VGVFFFRGIEPSTSRLRGGRRILATTERSLTRFIGLGTRESRGSRFKGVRWTDHLLLILLMSVEKEKMMASSKTEVPSFKRKAFIYTAGFQFTKWNKSDSPNVYNPSFNDKTNTISIPLASINNALYHYMSQSEGF
jgi:hypothetical protein